MKLINRVLDSVIDGLAFLAAAIVIFIILIVSAEVLLRYFLHRPLTWDVEITEYLLLYVTFLVAPWVLKSEGHVRVDILVSRLNKKAQAVFGFTSIIGVIVCGILVWYGAQVTWGNFVRHAIPTRSLLAVPYAPILVIIPIGSLLLMLQFVRRTNKYLKDFKASSQQNQY